MAYMRERPRPVTSAEQDEADVTDTLLLFRKDIEGFARGERQPAPAPARRSRGRGFKHLLPLLPVLAAQALLGVHLILAGRTASVEEAGNLFAGHLEIGHLMHGVPINNYPTFFSGAPVLYPVLGALADAAHGLIAARCLSLAFMLLATVAVYLTGRRIYGIAAGFAAAALFATAGPTLQLGSYATFDALAVCLVAWAVYQTVSFAYGDTRNALVYATGLMILADCVKYTVLLWDPVIVLIAGITVAQRDPSTWKVARTWNLQRFALLAGCLLGLALLIGREPYFTGVTSTFKLTSGSNLIPGKPWVDLARWVGPVVGLAVLAFAAQLLSRGRRGVVSDGRVNTGVTAAGLFLLGGVLGPLAQLAHGTDLSLDKQAEIGAVFAAVPAGWVFARMAATARQPERLSTALAMVLAFAAAVPLGISGLTQATALSDGWPDSGAMISALRPLVHLGTQNYLVEDASVAEYAFGKRVAWTQWHDTASVAWPTKSGYATGVAGARDAIEADYYSVIVLDYAETPSLDAQIFPVIQQSGYRLVASYEVPTSMGNRTFYIWDLAPGR